MSFSNVMFCFLIFGLVRTTTEVPSNSIIFERRQTSLLPPKLSNSQNSKQSKWIKSTISKWKNMYFWFGDVPLKPNHVHAVVQTNEKNETKSVISAVWVNVRFLCLFSPLLNKACLTHVLFLSPPGLSVTSAVPLTINLSFCTAPTMCLLLIGYTWRGFELQTSKSKKK